MMEHISKILPTVMEDIERQFHLRRSKEYESKEIESEGYTTIRKTRYYKRVFSDGSSELTRYDTQNEKWVHLCFLPK